jgi:hypothetical protein
LRGVAVHVARGWVVVGEVVDVKFAILAGVTMADPVAVATRATQEVEQNSELSDVHEPGVVRTFHVTPALRVSRSVTTWCGEVVAI